MTSFVHTDFSRTSPEVDRAGTMGKYFSGLRRNVDGSRGLATLLLAGGVAALLAVADRLIDTWADGHLLMAWAILWAVVFAGLALFADVARDFAVRVTVGAKAWAVRAAQERADAHLLNTARQDPRVMADIQAALSRADIENDLVDAPSVARRSVVAPKERTRALAESDQLMWNAALSDPRLMEDLQGALQRAETAALAVQDPVAQEAALAEVRATANRFPAVKRAVKRSYLVGIPANWRATAYWL